MRAAFARAVVDRGAGQADDRNDRDREDRRDVRARSRGESARDTRAAEGSREVRACVIGATPALDGASSVPLFYKGSLTAAAFEFDWRANFHPILRNAENSPWNQRVCDLFHHHFTQSDGYVSPRCIGEKRFLNRLKVQSGKKSVPSPAAPAPSRAPRWHSRTRRLEPPAISREWGRVCW